mmetsp:Transcript_60528/g.169646  ORF Transcript_60528/g.169646 Transcript_60528/m.169646 type:complete len:284 (+) Transcript_60528:1405-2256(+)
MVVVSMLSLLVHHAEQQAELVSVVEVPQRGEVDRVRLAQLLAEEVRLSQVAIGIHEYIVARSHQKHEPCDKEYNLALHVRDRAYLERNARPNQCEGRHHLEVVEELEHQEPPVEFQLGDPNQGNTHDHVTQNEEDPSCVLQHEESPPRVGIPMGGMLTLKNATHQDLRDQPDPHTPPCGLIDGDRLIDAGLPVSRQLARGLVACERVVVHQEPETPRHQHRRERGGAALGPLVTVPVPRGAANGVALQGLRRAPELSQGATAHQLARHCGCPSRGPAAVPMRG